jgi:O-antigen ligase
MSTRALPVPSSPSDLMVWLLLALLAGAVPLLAVSFAPLYPWVVALGAVAALLALGAMLVYPSLGALALILIAYWNLSEVLTKNYSFSWLLKGVMIWTGIAWLLQRLLRNRDEPFRWPLWKPVLLYGAIQALSAARAGSPVDAWGAVLEYGKAMVIFYLVINLLHTPRQWRQALQTIMVAALLLSLPVVYQTMTGSRSDLWGLATQEYKEIITGEFGWRPGGAIGDPNFLAMILVATMPIAAVQLLERREHWGRRLLAALALGTSLIAAAATYSRAAVVALGFITIVLFLRHPRRKLVLLAVTAGLAGIMAVMPASFFTRMSTLAHVSLTRQQQEIADSSFRARRGEMMTGILMARTHPVLGVGPGNYAHEFQTYAARVGLTPRDIMDPHSLYIQVAAETGLAGLAALFYLLGSALLEIWRAERTLRRMGAERFYHLLWGLEVGLESYLLTSVFLHGAYFRHFLILLAVAVLAASMVRQHSKPVVELLPATEASAA